MSGTDVAYAATKVAISEVEDSEEEEEVPKKTEGASAGKTAYNLRSTALRARYAMSCTNMHVQCQRSNAIPHAAACRFRNCHVGLQCAVLTQRVCSGRRSEQGCDRGGFG
eukprot:2407592-Rhodomonas_salina.2